jgi:hypothetical protein
VMIGVRITRRAPVRVPPGNLLPGIAAVGGAMQIDTAADYEIGIGGMDHDRVAIRNLPFAFEMIALNSFPAVTAIRAAEHTQQHIVIAAGFILRKRIEHIRSGRTNDQCGAPEV